MSDLQSENEKLRARVDELEGKLAIASNALAQSRAVLEERVSESTGELSRVEQLYEAVCIVRASAHAALSARQVALARVAAGEAKL